MPALQACVPNCAQSFSFEEFLDAPLGAYKFTSNLLHFRGWKLPDGRIVRNRQSGPIVYGADQCVPLPDTDPMTCEQ